MLEEMAQILDGKWVRDQILAECKPRVDALSKEARPPGLVVVLVGNDPASEIYVRNKIKACEELGIRSEKLTPPDTVTTAELLAMIEELNRRDDVDGILVQVPLPKQVDSRRCWGRFRPIRTSTGFTRSMSANWSRTSPALGPAHRRALWNCCGGIEIPITGRHATVVGRSDIVGKPMALMLLHESATVTICHSKTPDLAAECRRADILVAAIGRPALIRSEFHQARRHCDRCRA